MTTSQRVLKMLKRNALAAVPTALALVALNFFLLQLVPGDAADVLAGESGSATEETMRQLRTRFGLDLPMVAQLQAYLANLAQGSLGFSPRYGMPVMDLILQRLPRTLALMGFALGLAFALGVLIGTVMALNAGRWPDRMLSLATLLFYSVPGFWIGLMLIVLFSIRLGWLPSGGAETIASGLSGLADLALDRLRHMVLPGVTLALFFIAVYARVTRAAVMEVAATDFVRTARAKGLSGFAVRLAPRPAQRAAAGDDAGRHADRRCARRRCRGGDVFSWPGLGRLAFEAVLGARLQRAARRAAVVFAAGHRRQHPGRPAARVARSAYRGAVMARCRSR